MHETNNPVLISSKLSPARRERAQRCYDAYSSGFTGGMTEPENGEVASTDPCEPPLPLLSLPLLLFQSPQFTRVFFFTQKHTDKKELNLVRSCRPRGQTNVFLLLFRCRNV